MHSQYTEQKTAFLCNLNTIKEIKTKEKNHATGIDYETLFKAIKILLQNFTFLYYEKRYLNKQFIRRIVQLRKL